MSGYVCTVCGKTVAMARVWDNHAICRDCTFQAVGPCPVCAEDIAVTVTPLRNGRTHGSISHACNVDKDGDA